MFVKEVVGWLGQGGPGLRGLEQTRGDGAVGGGEASASGRLV